MLKLGTAGGASPWDYASPSPVPIRASGASVKSSSSRYGRTSPQFRFSRESSQSFRVVYGIVLSFSFPLHFPHLKYFTFKLFLETNELLVDSGNDSDLFREVFFLFFSIPCPLNRNLLCLSKLIFSLNLFRMKQIRQVQQKNRIMRLQKVCAWRWSTIQTVHGKLRIQFILY